MRDEEFVFFILILLVGGVLGWVGMRTKARSEELKIIERTLESGKMDEASRQRLVELLTDARRRDNEAWQIIRANASKVALTIVAIAGWLTFVIGVAVLIGAVLAGSSSYEISYSVIAIGVGFGLITLPMAMREIDARGPGRDRTS